MDANALIYKYSMEDKRKVIQNIEIMEKRMSKGSIDVIQNNLVKDRVENIYEDDDLSVM
jgi:hypothetical protein